MTRLLLLLTSSIVFIFSACQSDWPSQEEIEKAQFINMHGNRTKLRIPNTFMPSTQELLKMHVPLALKNELSKQVMEYNTMIIRYDDGDIDVFANTGDLFHHIVIVDTYPRFMDEQLKEKVENRLHRNFISIKNDFPELKVNVLENAWKNHGNYTYFKFKYKVLDRANPETQFFNSVYLITSKKRTYVAVENTENEQDLEAYLMTMVEID